MRERRSRTMRARTGLAGGVMGAMAIAGSCAPSAAPVTPRGASTAAAAPASGDASLASDGGDPSSSRGRTRIGTANEEPMPITLTAIPGGRGVLAVSHSAGERVAWARRIDGATGALGPLLHVVDERVIGAFDGKDGAMSMATSDGVHVCIALYRAGASDPEKRGCAEVAPVAIAPLGDRLAMIELHGSGAPAARSTHVAAPIRLAPPPPRRVHKPLPAKIPSHTTRRPVPPTRTRPAPAHPPPPRPPPIATIDVHVRWATLDGAIDTTTTATGLKFDRPLTGMALIATGARAGALDLVWYESANASRASHTAKAVNANNTTIATGRYGSARFGAASLRADGTLDPTSRVAASTSSPR